MNPDLNKVIDYTPIYTEEYKNDNNRAVFKNTISSMEPENIVVVTHGDIFHADEILAITVLIIAHRSTNVKIIRVHRKNLDALSALAYVPTYEDIFNEVVSKHTSSTDRIFMVDCGRIFNNLWAFDHHQDKELEAASSLVAKRFFNLYFMQYHKEFFSRISTIDCDTSKIDGAERTTEFSNLIRNLNAGGEFGFTLALSMSIGVLKGMISEHVQFLITGDNYHDMIKAGNVRYSDELMETFKWQKYAETEGVKAIITRDRNNEDQYVLISRDTKEFVIPEGYNSVFRHNSGFMATYSNMEDAMNAVNGGKI